MADLLSQNRILPTKVRVQGDIGVADFKSGVNFPKFKMADPIWRIYVLKKIDFCQKKSCSGGYRGR